MIQRDIEIQRKAQVHRFSERGREQKERERGKEREI